jgi:hypothetical protein
MILLSFLGFLGGMCIGIGELGSVYFAIIILPIPFVIELIISITYYKKYKNTKNKLIYIFQFSVFIFIVAIFLGCEYKVVEINSVENYLKNAENIVNEYKLNNNLEHLSENDFKNINLNKKITIEISDDGYLLRYRYGIFYYNYKDGEGRIRVRRN